MIAGLSAIFAIVFASFFSVVVSIVTLWVTCNLINLILLYPIGIRWCSYALPIDTNDPTSFFWHFTLAPFELILLLIWIIAYIFFKIITTLECVVRGWIKIVHSGVKF